MNGMNGATLQQVKEMAADIFNVPVHRIAMQSSPDTIQEWDSLNHLNFVLSLEQRFGLQFDPEEIEQMTDIERAAVLVEEKLHRAASSGVPA